MFMAKIRKFSVVGVLLLLVIALPHAGAQEGQPLVYGDMVEGTIDDPDTTVSYVFEAGASDVIGITVLADGGSFDPAIDLYDPAGELLVSVEDTYLLNPALLGYWLEQAGEYTITVRSQDGQGDFIIILDGERGYSRGEILFEETFDNNDMDWETADDEGVFSDIVDGQYVIEHDIPEPGNYWVVAPGFTDDTYDIWFEEPYEFQVEVSDVQSSTGRYQVSAIFNVGFNYSPFTMFTIYHDGRWKLWDSTTAEYAEGLIEPIDFMDGTTRTLTVRVMEGTYAFLIDDLFVASTDAYLYATSGRVGFGIGGVRQDSNATVSAHFDNLVVYDLE
ncbi:MAG: hypothetical protein JXJ20_13715 [Anaerolineae bacterium]|nr:hypothetical protein [Anaerolineae bacterium]